MAKKKKPAAQLNREIDMALHKRNVTALRQARENPRHRDPAIDALLERGYSLERAEKAATPYHTRLEATAGFTIHTDHQDLIEDNARDRFGHDGNAAERAKQLKAGFIDARGTITDRGWKQLVKDMRVLEDNGLFWLKKVFEHAREEGHDASGDLIGSITFDPWSPVQADNLIAGRNERIDFSDTTYGDFAKSRDSWKGVSPFGQSLLGGSINFFDIQPPEADDIVEEAAERRRRR